MFCSHHDPVVQSDYHIIGHFSRGKLGKLKPSPLLFFLYAWDNWQPMFPAMRFFFLSDVAILIMLPVTNLFTMITIKAKKCILK